MNPIEDLLGAQVLDGKKQPVAVASISGKGKVIGLYFSAHWCPPCRGFTPALAECYLKLKASHPNGFEVVFVSSDRDESQWSDYFAEMPWLALPFNDRDRKSAIATKYGITGIPTLILLDAETGETINADARTDVDENPDGKGFPWRK